MKHSVRRLLRFLALISVVLAGLLNGAHLAAAAPSVIATVAVGTGPRDVAVNASTNRVYVANQGSNSVTVINGGSNAVVTTIAVGSSPLGVGVNASTNRVYVANLNSNTVSVIDGGSNTVIATVSVGTGPAGVGVNASTNRVYVTNFNSNTVSVIDGGSNTVVATIPVGTNPIHIGVNVSTNRVYAANFNSNAVSVIDGGSNSVIATIPVNNAPQDVGVNATTNRIYIPNTNSGNVSVIDGSSNTVITTIPVGTGPAGIAVNASINRVYVSNFNANTESVIDGGSNTVIATVSVGTGPAGVGVNASTNRAYVADNSSNNASVISDPPDTPTASQAPTLNPLTVGQSTTLTITLNNFSFGYGTLSNLAFSFTLPTGLVVAPPSPSSNCGGSVNALTGGSAVSFSGGTLGLGQTCTITIGIQANGAALGATILSLFNVTSAQVGFVAGAFSGLTINKGLTTSSVSSSPNPSIGGQTVTFLAVVTANNASSAGIPTGTVTYLDGASPIATNVPLFGGFALFNTSTLSTGPHNITVQYNGDSLYAGSTSSILVQTVNAPTPKDTIGIYRPSAQTFYLRHANATGYADYVIPFGGASSLPLVGDWNGDGVDTVGTLNASNGLFSLTDGTLPPYAVTYSFVLGNPGDQPYAGRWDNSINHDGVGVFRPSNGLLYLRDQLTTGFADHTMVLGIPGDQGIAGDWDGNGFDSPGVYRPSNNTFYMTNQVCNCSVFADYTTTFGSGGSGALGFAGDWTGSGHAGVGLYQNGLVSLKVYPYSGSVADISFTFGVAGDEPVAGYWGAVSSKPPPSVLVPPTAVPMATGLGD